MTSQRAILFAALLTTVWPNGHVQNTSCVDDHSCDLAAKFDTGRGALTTTIVRNLTPKAAGFPTGWDCIQGYNCASGKNR